MEIASSYSNLITNNVEIWGQALFLGLLVVGVSSLLGLLVHATVAIFRMISNG